MLFLTFVCTCLVFQLDCELLKGRAMTYTSLYPQCLAYSKHSIKTSIMTTCCSDVLFLKDIPMPCKNSSYHSSPTPLLPPIPCPNSQNPVEWQLLKLLLFGVASNSPKYQSKEKPIPFMVAILSTTCSLQYTHYRVISVPLFILALGPACVLAIIGAKITVCMFD